MGKSNAKMIGEGRRHYRLASSVYCAAVKTSVVFNRHGWNHILRNGHGHRRNISSIRLRLYLLPFAGDVIKNCLIVDKKDKRRVGIRGGKTVEATFIEISGVVDGGRKYITVILRQFPEGPLHFYSIRNHRKAKSYKTKKP